MRSNLAKIQPINKTIGINKLGTLLSSQTTDPPKHHPTGTPHKAAHHNRAIGKEELFLAAYRTVHTFRLSVSHPATQKTIHAPQPQRKSTTQHPHTNPQNPTKPPSNTTYKDSAWSGFKAASGECIRRPEMTVQPVIQETHDGLDPVTVEGWLDHHQPPGPPL